MKGKAPRALSDVDRVLM